MITNETNRYVSPYENDLRRIFNEKNKEKQTSKVVFGISSSSRKGGFIEN